MKKNLLFIITSLCIVNTAYSGAWTQKHGEGYYKIGIRIVRANKFYQSNGNKITIPTLGDYTTSFYSEYGLSKRLTAIISLPFYKRTTLNRQIFRTSGTELTSGGSLAGIADTDIGLRIGLLHEGQTALSVDVLLGLPLGEDTPRNGLVTGDGELNQLFRLQLGHSFYPSRLYLNGQFGFNNRTKGYSDEFHYAAEVGYNTGEKSLLILHVNGVESLKNGNDTGQGGTGGLFGNNQRYLTYGPELIYSFNHTWGISLGVEGATRAQNILSAPAYSLGLFLKK